MVRSRDSIDVDGSHGRPNDGGRPGKQSTSSAPYFFVIICCVVLTNLNPTQTCFKYSPSLSLGSTREKYNVSLSSFPSSTCAINLYGLPRSFKHHVLPSLFVNVMEVNKQYNCDYYVHAHNISFEAPGRSGGGGGIYPEDVHLIKNALKIVYEAVPKAQMPTVDIAFYTDDDFEKVRSNELRTIMDASPKAQNPYSPNESVDTFRNILKMWHAQEHVWKLMESGRGGRSPNCAENIKLKCHYDRVMMLRLDVVYVTPIDIWKVRRDCHVDEFQKRTKCPEGKGNKNNNNRTNGDDLYFNDSENNYAVIPEFGSYPVNDRMIYGPYHAVKVWASERFKRAQSHVMETHVVNPMNKQIVTIVPPKVSKSDKRMGLHDETFVAMSLLPAIKEEHGISVQVDPGIWFMRVRADGSIWILDAPAFPSRPKLGDPTVKNSLEKERQRLEEMFQTYHEQLQQYHEMENSQNNSQSELWWLQKRSGRYCSDVYKAEVPVQTGQLQIKCPHANRDTPGQPNE